MHNCDCSYTIASLHHGRVAVAAIQSADLAPPCVAHYLVSATM